MGDFRTVPAGRAFASALVTACLASACGTHQSVSAPAPPAAPQQPETARSSADESAGERLFDAKQNPRAAIGTLLDPPQPYVAAGHSRARSLTLWRTRP